MARVEMERTQEAAGDVAPRSFLGKLRIVGPGIVLAGTTVGVGDLVATMVAGGEFGSVLVWTVVLAAVLKYFMTEGLGRWHLATGTTIIAAWHSFGRWATGFVTIYLLIWAFIYGAAGPSIVGLVANAMIPALSIEVWAIAHAVLALAIVWIGRYHIFENIMKVMIGVQLLAVIFIAILLRPDLGDLATGLIPRVPDGAVLYAVGIVGGLGGTLALASYGYWVRDKGWRSSTWIPVMRFDTGLGYVVTGIFGVATMIIGAEVFYGTDANLGDEEGLPLLADNLGTQFGGAVEWIFLIGFWAISFASVMGVWNGIPYLFTDLLRTFLNVPDAEAERFTSERSPAYRAFLVLLTFGPIPLVIFGQPVGLVQLWVTMGAVFLPFLSITLLVLLNTGRVGREFRNTRFSFSNIVLVGSVVIFVILAVQTILDQF